MRVWKAATVCLHELRRLQKKNNGEVAWWVELVWKVTVKRGEEEEFDEALEAMMFFCVLLGGERGGEGIKLGKRCGPVEGLDLSPLKNGAAGD